MKRFIGSLVFGAAIASARAQVLNGSFENWTDNCTIDQWFNSTICGVAAPVTKTTTAHSGSFAVRGEVVSFFGQKLAPILQSGSDAQGTPISQRYASVDGFYQFAPVGGDRFGLNVAFYLGETVIAQGAQLFPASASYAPLSVPMVYMTDDVPDRAIIQVQIIGPVTGSDFHVGSVMYLDDLSFTGGGGTAPDPRLTIVRNPNSTVTVSWPADVIGYRLQATPNLSPLNWTDVPGLVAADRSYTFTPATEGYFRLIKNGP